MKVKKKSRCYDLIGNGDSATLFLPQAERNRDKKTYICNLPPFGITDVEATFIVDFKMMASLTQGSIDLKAYKWILGNRPKIWMSRTPSFYMMYAPQVQEFYLDVPKYAKNATNFNCGHMGAHFLANKKKAKEIHMWGFDSIFDHNMRSMTDVVLGSDRSDMNNHRLLNNWRPIWTGIFEEFPETQFVLHHTHKNVKIDVPSNVIVVEHENDGRIKN